MVRPRVRIRFWKRSALRLIGHRDLVRSLERAIRRAGLALGMSEGHRPRPRMHFPLALAVGMEGHREVMEIELHETPSPDDLLARLRAQAPAGLGFESAERLPPDAAKARTVSASYQVAVPAWRAGGLEERIERLLHASTLPVRRANRTTPIDVRPALVKLVLRGAVVEMRLKTSAAGAAGPRDVLTALQLEDLEREGAVLCRTDVEIDSAAPSG